MSPVTFKSPPRYSSVRLAPVHENRYRLWSAQLEPLILGVLI